MRPGISRIVALGFALSAIALASGAAEKDAQVPTEPFDVLIRGGRVIDGTGNPDFRADVGIRGDRIAAVGHLAGAGARRLVEAAGLVVAPGFIDPHSHADRALVRDYVEARQAYSLNHQGLTTVLGAPDGRNAAWPLSEEVAAYERPGIALNVALMVGHNTVREQVMGDDHERDATADEVERMKALVRQAMEEGAWGLFAGLEYRPGRFSSRQEVLELARVVAEYDGFYIAHQRSEAAMPLWQLPSLVDGWPVDGLQGLEETIDIARRTGIPVVASHQKARGRSSFGRSLIDIELVNGARAEGLQVYLDVYPYETTGGGPTSVMPNWPLVDPQVDTTGGNDSRVFREDGVFANARTNLKRRWADPTIRRRIERDIEWLVDHQGGPERVVVVDYPDAALVGKTLVELAAEWRVTVPEAVVRLQQEGDPDVPAGVLLRGHSVSESDIENYIRMEYTAMGSDAAVSGVAGVERLESRPGDHPRHFGAFVRKISRYVKQRQVITLPFAIRSMTTLPAQIIGLRDRGQVREGFKADLVVFDVERLRDRSTVLEPSRPSEGVEYVMVSGQFTIDGGRPTGALPGVIIRKPRPES